MAVFSFVLVGSIRQNRRGRENLRRLAATMNLRLIEPEKKWVFQSGSVSLEGKVRGRSIRIHSFTKGSGKNRTYWCAARVGVENNRNLSLTISSENIFTRLGGRLGFKQALAGDKAFDEKFYIKCSDEDFLRAALIPEVRARFVDVWNSGTNGKVTADEGWVSFVEQGAFASDKICARFPGATELICDVAEIVETHSRLG